MAKRGDNQRGESGGAAVVDGPKVDAETGVVDGEPVVDADGCVMASVAVPMLATDPGHRAVSRIDVALDRKQRRGLARLYEGLHRKHEKTDNGQHVDRHAHALKWLLERLADAGGVEA